MSATPDHYCRVPFLEALNFTETQIKNISIPLEVRDGRMMFSQCNMYDVDEATILAHMNEYDTLIKIYDAVHLQLSSNASLYPMVPCKYGWNYDFSTYTSTIVSEWNVVCEKSFLPTFALVMLGLSGIVGNYVFGNLQDSLGRRPSFFIYLTIQCFFGIGTGFAVDFWSWLVMRIGVGFTVPALMNTPFVLACELVGPDRRTLCTLLLNIAYSLILMTLAVVAYIFRDWRDLAFVTTLPFLLFFSYWWILPESPRWLFAHGKLEKTERILRQMAHMNGRALPSDYNKILQMKYTEKIASEQLDETSSSYRETNHKYGILDLLRGKVLRRNTIIITFIWFTTMGVYVGLSYYAPALGGDEYFNFFLAGLAELPTYFFLFPLLDNWGRRWTLFSSLVLGGIACICTILIAQQTWLTLTLYCVGKFGISAGFVAIQQMALEIYPTVVRGLGISFSSVIGMIGPALVPLVNYTGQEFLYLPLLTLGILMVLGGMAALGLPETLGLSLPQTLADAELFQVDCSLGSCCPNKKPTLGKKSRKNVSKTVAAIGECEHSKTYNMGTSTGGDSTALGIPMTTQQRSVNDDDHNNSDLDSFHEFDKSGYHETNRAYRRVSDIETTQVFLEQEHAQNSTILPTSNSQNVANH
ncbi:unnamed protein product [Orchesella dallaii]